MAKQDARNRSCDREATKEQDHNRDLVIHTPNRDARHQKGEHEAEIGEDGSLFGRQWPFEREHVKLSVSMRRDLSRRPPSPDLGKLQGGGSPPFAPRGPKTRAKC